MFSKLIKNFFIHGHKINFKIKLRKVKVMKRIFVLIAIAVLFLPAYAQHSEPSYLKALRIDGKIDFDGRLTEPFWKEAMHISNFTQRDLHYGEPVSERTEVAVVYDKHGLYFGIWCYQKDPATIVAKSLSVDFDYESEDNFQIMLSPFDDNRTGYLFIINPYGARADLQIFNFEDGNLDWNGVWDAKTSITDSGWFAEVFIDYSTLQFKNDSEHTWALNFERDIMSKNEQSLWQGWSRDKSIMSVEAAGKLVGLKNIGYVHRFELKPYTLVGYQYDQSTGVHFPLKAGADLNVNITPSLKLNLTTFTDFAQVEVDRIPVNLTRFSIYYPEKRQFFLEGSNYFQFYLGYRTEVFYTREIGLENGKQVPIWAGARLFGKVGRSEIGFLNMQEAPIDTIPSTNNLVFRYKQEIGKQSYVGGIVTNKINAHGSNQVIGLDAEYRTSEFLRNKNLTIGAKIASSFEDFQPQEQALAWRIYLDYPNDLIDNYMGINVIERNFDPQLGFLYRTNYDAYSWYFRLSPRVFKKLGVKRLLLKPWGFTMYRTHTTGELESFYNETRPLGAVFKTGDRFEFNLQHNFDRLDEPFALTDSVVIPVGRYWMYKYEIQLESFQGRRLWFFFLYNWGGFYTGRIHTIELVGGWNINKNLNLREEYTFNKVILPQGTVKTHELATYLNLAFTTKLNVSAFVQFNSLENVMIYNIRLHWIPKVGSDFYFVLTTGYDEPIHQVELLKPYTTATVAKLVYRITF